MKKPKFKQMNDVEAAELRDLIIVSLDPICLRVYQEGDVLPRGEECSTVEAVNKTQGYRKLSATQKAERIVKLVRAYLE